MLTAINALICKLANTPSETSPETRPHRLPALLCATVVLVVNLVIVARLFGVEYSAYNGSVEGSFIANARGMARYRGEWSWWPMWSGGMPFEPAPLPFSHW